jgi:hypothetical protein
MARASTLVAIAGIAFFTAVPALAAGGGHSGAARNGVTYHPNQRWTVGTPASNVRDHRNGNPGGGVTITTGTPPNANLHHGGPHMNQPPSRWRGTGTVRDHRGSKSGHHR